MFKPLLISTLVCVVMFIKALPQSSIQPALSNNVFHAPSSDKESWQRLNLWLSSTYIFVVKEGQLDRDSCLFRASRSLGLSRFSILAEGIDDPELVTQSQWIDQKNSGNAIPLLSQTTGKKHLELLILLGAYYAFEPQSYFHYRDSVEYFLSKAVNESKTLKEGRLGRQARCLLVKMYLQAYELKKGDSIFSPLIKECDIAGDMETAARAFAYRGIYTPFSPATIRNQIADLQKAADIYQSLNNTEGEINALTDIGYLLSIILQPQKAYNAFLKALQQAEAIHYPYIQYNTDALAWVTESEGKFGEPLKFTLQTIKAAENSRDSIGWAYFYSRLYLLYNMEGGKEKESEKLWYKAMNRFILDRNPALYELLHDQIDRMNGKGLNREALDLVAGIAIKVPPINFTEQFFYHIALSTCYTDLRQFESAELHLSKADSLETLAESIRGPLRRSEVYDQYGSIYFSKGQYRKARDYFEKYFETVSRGSQIIGNDLKVYYSLIRIDSILQDPTAGIAHYKKYTQLLDSNLSVSKIRQGEELNVMYQTEEKENQISLLNQQAKLEQANLKQANILKNVTIGGIIAVLIIAALLYRQNKLKQKNNTVITRKNEQLQHYLTEKEWLLKELHHRVKNNLQVMMSLQDLQARNLTSTEALTAVKDSSNRLYAMSLIHQKLYRQEGPGQINVGEYVGQLVRHLTEAFAPAIPVKVETNLATDIELDVTQAIPVGLILNEAITNTFKYAFTRSPMENSVGVAPAPQLRICLSRTGNDGEIELLIKDNGHGYTAAQDKSNRRSLGFSLMEALTGELDGELSILNEGGLTIILHFIPYIGGTARESSSLQESFT